MELKLTLGHPFRPLSKHEQEATISDSGSMYVYAITVHGAFGEGNRFDMPWKPASWNMSVFKQPKARLVRSHDANFHVPTFCLPVSTEALDK